MENNGEKRRIWRRTRNLSLSASYRETSHCSLGDSDKGTVFGEFFTDRPGIDILYYPEKRDDNGELIIAGHYVLLRRATLLSQPENEKVYSLGGYVAVCSATTDWFMCDK